MLATNFFGKTLFPGVILTMLAALCGCQTTNPYTGEAQTSNTAQKAIIGAVGGAAVGAVIGNNTGDRNAGRGALIGAAAGGLAGAGIGNYMDKQEAVIREQLQGSGVSVTRVGNQINLNMPNDITFASASDQIQPRAANVLDSVALVLREYHKTLVTINGHTDSDGNDSYNQALSERRAAAVASYLAGKGVTYGRLISRGFGKSQPIASNATADGKAQNRRVEIQILPRE